MADEPVGGLVRVTTPIVKAWMDQGVTPPIVEAWTAPARRLFVSVTDRWTRARMEASGRRLDAVKALYRVGGGLLASPGGLIYRPDWYRTIMDRQRVTVLGHVRRVHERTGVWPLRVHTDCIWWPTTESDPVRWAEQAGITIGQGVGRFKVQSSRPAGDLIKRRTP